MATDCKLLSRACDSSNQHLKVELVSHWGCWLEAEIIRQKNRKRTRNEAPASRELYWSDVTPGIRSLSSYFFHLIFCLFLEHDWSRSLEYFYYLSAYLLIIYVLRKGILKARVNTKQLWMYTSSPSVLHSIATRNAPLWWKKNISCLKHL